MAYTALDGDPSTPAGLLAALPPAETRAGPSDLCRPPLDAGRQGCPTPPRRTVDRPVPRCDGIAATRGRTIDRWPVGPANPYLREPWRPPRRSIRGVPVVGGAAGTTRPVDDASKRSVEPDPEADVARAAAAPAADDHLDRRPDRRSSPPSSRSTAQQLVEGPRRSILAANRLAGARGIPRLLCRIPVARLPLGDPAARHRCAHRDEGLDRDHLPVLARQLCRAGQARRRLPRLPAEDQQPDGIAVANVRDRLHRARPRSLRHRAAGPRRRLLELPERAAAGHPGRVRHRRRRRGRSRLRALHDAQLRAPDHRRAAACRTRSSSSTTASRRACSGPSRAAPAAPRLPDRASSG